MSWKRTVGRVGMMGAGRSRVRPDLAERLALPHVATDAEVERGAGRTIAEILQRQGEAAFRSRGRGEIEASAGEGARLAALLGDRRVAYESAGVVVNVGAGAVQEIANAVVRRLADGVVS